MNHKCYLCGIGEAQIIERPGRGYLGNYVICPSCTEYKITTHAILKINNGHRVPDSLIQKVRDHFKKTGKPDEIGTPDLDIG
jgi:hypothetical protein